jgi:hypothetical protein
LKPRSDERAGCCASGITRDGELGRRLLSVTVGTKEDGVAMRRQYCTLSLCAVELIINCHSLDIATGLAASRQCRRRERCGRFTSSAAAVPPPVSHGGYQEGVSKLAFNPLAPILGGGKRGTGGHPQTLGKGALPLCTPRGQNIHTLRLLAGVSPCTLLRRTHPGYR